MTSPGDAAQYLPTEQRARVAIDRQLTAAGWAVQDQRDLNLFGGRGVAVREVVMATGHGRVDYPRARPCPASSGSRPLDEQRRIVGILEDQLSRGEAAESGFLRSDSSSKRGGHEGIHSSRGC